MTRFLSESLQAPEPFFRLNLQKMEAKAGHPNADIHLSSEVQQATRAKLRQLGLDPADTTATELYHFLQTRLKTDDGRLVKKLRSLAATHISAEGQVVDGMIHALKGLPVSQRCFAIRNSSLKRLLRQLPPKKAMKQLGYRSLDSFLKHEPPVSILAAARLAEGPHWQSHFLQNYKKLRASDFEERAISLLKPTGKHWQELANSVVAGSQHNLLALKEAGALVFLPLPHDVPAGTVTASLALALHELNSMRSSSSYLKLCQVRPDFGRLVQSVAAGELNLSSSLFDTPVPWKVLHRYYAKLKEFGQSLQEPHLQTEDLSWQKIEHSLSQIEPSFSFWHGSDYLAMLHGQHAVSLNVLDAALNTCNQLPFERRVVHFFQHSLWHELLMRYFQPATAAHMLQNELQPELAEELVEA